MSKEKNIKVTKKGKDTVISRVNTEETVLDPLAVEKRKQYLIEQMRNHVEQYNKYLELEEELDLLNNVK